MADWFNSVPFDPGDDWPDFTADRALVRAVNSDPGPFRFTGQIDPEGRRWLKDALKRQADQGHGRDTAACSTTSRTTRPITRSDRLIPHAATRITFGQPTIPVENCSIAMRGRIRRRIGPGAERLPDDVGAEHVADGSQDHRLRRENADMADPCQLCRL